MTCHDYTPGVNTGCAGSCACEQISAQNRPIRAGESIPAHRLDDHSGNGQSILAEAEALVYGDRGRDYGPPDEGYGRAVAIYHAMTGSNLMNDAADGIRFMVAVKLSRMAVSPHKRDHYVDACGYLDCLWRVVNPRNATEETAG